jgi:membrane fusion protein (multidrug efflux system)
MNGQPEDDRMHSDSPGPGPAPVAPPPPAKRRRPIALFVLLGLGLVSLTFAARTLSFYRHNVRTNDAEIEGHISPVLPRVAGHVLEVLVDDNQPVQAGQVIVRIDPRDLQVKVEQARAALENSRAAVAVTRANVEAARTERDHAHADLMRYVALQAKQEISQQQYDGARAAADAADAQYAATLRQVSAAEAQVAQKEADLDFAKLQLSYATVRAPAAGVVSKKSVEVGEFVQAGQPLLAVVQDSTVWVVANFKETQLRWMRVGQLARIEVDAYPGHAFTGRVESIAPATGAKFALLPPDNATGNFVKVVQRIPVKIVFDDPPSGNHPLRPGMSVDATVRLD